MNATAQKVADNVLLVLLSRLAMVGAIPASAAMLYMAEGWLEARFISLQVSVGQLERDVQELKVKEQDHEIRLQLGKQAREAFQRDAEIVFEKIDAKIDRLSNQMSVVNESVTKLSTTLVERLPTKTRAELPGGFIQ